MSFKKGTKVSKKYRLDQIIEAIRAHKGMITLAADALHVNARTIYTWRKQYPEVDEAIYEARGRFVDRCELALDNAVEEGEGWAVCFALKCLGKDRGYVERHEIVGKDSGPLEIVLQWADGSEAK